MVKAIQIEDSTRPTPKESSQDKLSIENFDDDVKFEIDFDESVAPVKEAVSEKAKGGTELMRDWLFDELEKREPGLKDKYQFISTRVRHLEDKPRILWVHDLAMDPEVQHLKDQASWERFE